MATPSPPCCVFPALIASCPRRPRVMMLTCLTFLDHAMCVQTVTWALETRATTGAWVPLGSALPANTTATVAVTRPGAGATPLASAPLRPHPEGGAGAWVATLPLPPGVHGHVHLVATLTGPAHDTVTATLPVSIFLWAGLAVGPLAGSRSPRACFSRAWRRRLWCSRRSALGSLRGRGCRCLPWWGSWPSRRRRRRSWRGRQPPRSPSALEN